MIQIRWSDEWDWKDLRPLNGGTAIAIAMELAHLRRAFDHDRQRYRLRYVMEVRVR